jgi:putative methyltransferase (TIGR04325 family)
MSQNMFVLSHTAAAATPIRVLELGGACGASYFELNHLMPGVIGSWAVVETPRMAAAGREFFQDEKISFFDDLSAAAANSAGLDLVIAQGVLQYCDDPILTLDSLLSLDFRYIYLTRTMVSTETPTESVIITRQVTNLSDHGPGAAPPNFKSRQSTQVLTLISYESLSSQINGICQPLICFHEGDDALLIGSRSVATRLMGLLATKVSNRPRLDENHL